MKPEARLWATMSKAMPLPGDRFDRVENSVGTGQPDVNACLAGEDVWIELKAPTEPKRANTVLMTSNGNHPLLISQINWFARQRQAQGIAFILVRTDRRIMLIDGTKHADAFNSWTVSEMEANAIECAPVPVDKTFWRVLRYVIFTASRHRRLHLHASAQRMLDDVEREGVAGDRQPGRRAAVAQRPNTPRGARGRNRGTER